MNMNDIKVLFFLQNVAKYSDTIQCKRPKMVTQNEAKIAHEQPTRRQQCNGRGKERGGTFF